MKKNVTNLTITSSLVLGGVLAMVMPQPSLAASKSEKLANATATLESALSSAYDGLSDEEQASVYAKRYDAVVDLLNDAQMAVYDAKYYVPYVLFANLQEKASIYAALQDVQAQLINYEYDVEVINGKYDSTGEGVVNGSDDAVDTDGDGVLETPAVDAANDEMTSLIEDLLATLNTDSNKSAFATAVKSVLKEKLDAAFVYTKTSMAALNRAEDAYAAMGQDTTKLVNRLTAAQEAYDAAKTSYDTATTALEAGDTTTAVQNFNQSARRMVAVYAGVLAAQKEVNSLEAANELSPTFVD